MSFVYNLLVATHLIGMAAIVGAFFVVMRTPRYVPAFLYGAITQLVTGVLLVGLLESGVVGDEPVNHLKIGVKLLIALAVAVLAWMERKNTESAPAGTVHSIGALSLANVLVASLWQ